MGWPLQERLGFCFSTYINLLLNTFTVYVVHVKLIALSIMTVSQTMNNKLPQSMLIQGYGHPLGQICFRDIQVTPQPHPLAIPIKVSSIIVTNIYYLGLIAFLEVVFLHSVSNSG